MEIKPIGFYNMSPVESNPDQNIGRYNRLQALINVPAWFKVGIKFKSKWIKEGRNVCTLQSFDTQKNIAEVRIKILDAEAWVESDWNLQHTLWGFDSSDYKLIEK